MLTVVIVATTAGGQWKTLFVPIAHFRWCWEQMVMMTTRAIMMMISFYYCTIGRKTRIGGLYTCQPGVCMELKS